MLSFLPKALRSTLNITVLFSALVVTPLLALSHFNAGLASMLGKFADSYLPNPTLLSSQTKARNHAHKTLHQERVGRARQQAALQRKAKSSSKLVNKKGQRVLLRGAGALAVGWIPVLGATADVVSLSEDFQDICELFHTIDELLDMLQLREGKLYEENYCHLPEQGIATLKENASVVSFPWQEAGAGVGAGTVAGAEQ